MANRAVEINFKVLFTYKVGIWIACMMKKETVSVELLNFSFYPKKYPLLSKILGVKKNWVIIYWIKIR